MKKLPNALSWAQRAGFVFSYFTLSLKCKRINLRCRSNSPENARIQRYPYLFSSTLCAKIHQLSLLSQFAKPGLWLFVSFFQKHIFPIVCSWAAEPPARHKFSLNSPSCSKSDSTTSDLLVTTCSQPEDLYLPCLVFITVKTTTVYISLTAEDPQRADPLIFFCTALYTWNPERLDWYCWFPLLAQVNIEMFGK